MSGKIPGLVNLSEVDLDGHGHRWDVWRLDATNYQLGAYIRGAYDYWVDLERCTTSAETLDWIIQIAEKSWATADVLAGLVHAFNDLIRPQATLCGMGQSKQLSKRHLRSLVDQFASKHPELLTTQPM